MKLLIFTLTLILFTQPGFSQNHFKRNDIYIETGGNGLFISANYERQLTKEPGLGVRMGIGMYSGNTFYLTVPIGINYLFTTNNPKGFIDAGLGTTFARENAKLFWEKKTIQDDHFVSFIPSIGYRRHTTQNMMWRISCTPVINQYGFVPWIGFSVGKRF
ncbi:hypothetical protein [Hydrotalea sp.]|uniref:hypothetical protein n=1 Tax=Hydrotalea sp. TaxID=2881279 RepID=UPI00260DD9E6|nr:hypothetical protein [Hydrotalea sp.]